MALRAHWDASPWFRGYLALCGVIVAANLPFLFLTREVEADGVACTAAGVATQDSNEQQAEIGSGATRNDSQAPVTSRPTSSSSEVRKPQTYGNNASEIIIILGRRAGALDVSVPLYIENTTGHLFVSVDGLVRQPGGASLSGAVTAGVVRRDGSHVVLQVCVERGSAASGLYRGDLEIVSDQASLVVPIRVEIEATGWLAFGIAGALWTWVLVGGLAYVYWAVGPSVNREDWNQYISSTQFYKRFGEWILSPGALIALVLGAIGALGVYIVFYLRGNSWSGEPISEIITGLSAMAAGFTTAALTVYRIASPTASERLYEASRESPRTLGARPEITGSDAANAAKLHALGFTATPATPWRNGQQITVGAHAFHWDGAAWAPGPAGALDAAPGRSFASPGSSFAARPDISGSDAANAARLGFTATPATPWTSGQQIKVGRHKFHWDGSSWQGGGAA